MRTIAFVGDVHGSIDALEGILEAIRSRRPGHIVFLGDYINKGPASDAVLTRLIALSRDGSATLLRGNHETALIRAIEEQNLATFLKMGGAATIRAYVGGNVGPDVLGEFTAAVPREHIEAIRGMPSRFQTMRLIAQHEPPKARGLLRFGRFSVTAHRPIGGRPKIGPRSAAIDTGCGDGDGRLTAFFWPSRDYVQVGPGGELV
jgi:serine/threonine protein phosphatase 1